MARAQISGTASLTVVATFVVAYNVPAGNNYEIDYISMQNQSPALAAGNEITMTEMNGATVVGTIATLTPNVQQIATPTKYIVAAGNAIRISCVVGATLTTRYAIFGNLV